MDSGSAVREKLANMRGVISVSPADPLSIPYIVWGVARVVALGNISGRWA